MISLTALTTAFFTALKSTQALGNRVFPIVANEGTSMPYAVYMRDGLSAEKTKDGIASITPTFSVNIVASTYFEGLSIADDVIGNVLSMTSTDFNVSPALVSSSEEYTEEGFIQTLTFTI